MKNKFVLSLLLFCIIPILNASTTTNTKRGIKQYEIDETKIYTVTLHPTIATTIIFPVADGIEGIHGVNITKSTNAKADFFVEFSPGTNFISLRSTPDIELNEKTPPEKLPRGSLNIIYKKKIIVIQLLTTINQNNADKSIYFIDKKQIRSLTAQRTTPSVLVSLLDKAKALELFEKHYPEALDNVQTAKNINQISAFQDYDIIVQDAIRFDPQDTIVLRCFITNKTDKPLELDVQSFATRIGDKLLHASIVDCTNIIPPNATIPAYIAFTGTPYGGRNQIAPDNKWKILVSKSQNAYIKLEKERLTNIYNKINENLSEEELSNIEAKIKREYKINDFLNNNVGQDE